MVLVAFGFSRLEGAMANADSYSIYLYANSLLKNTTVYGNSFTHSNLLSGGDAYSYSIYFYAGVSITNITISSNTFADSSIVAGGTGVSYSISINSGASIADIIVSSNTFTDNNVQVGGDIHSYGIYFNAIGLLTNATISNNSFLLSSTDAAGNVFSVNIYLSSSSLISNVSISNNTFSDSNPTAGGNAVVYGISVTSQSEFTSIIDNQFNNLIAFVAFDVQITGISMHKGSSNTISSNSFQNITAESLNGDAIASGIYLSDTVNTTIDNNNFEFITAYTPNGISYSYGISLSNCTYYTVDYNIIQYISAVGGFHEIYLENTYNGEIGIDDDYGTDVTWVDPTLIVPINGSYTVFIDQTNETYGFWNASIMIPLIIADLSSGTHNVTIFISNGTHSVTETIWVFVSDNILPEFSSSQGVSYEQGDTGYNISWTFTDLYPSIYLFTLYLNSIEQETSTWTSGDPEIVILDGFEVGTYNFTMIFRDKFGHSFSYTIMVMVEDTTDPIVTGSADVTHEQGSTGNIEWIGEDYNPDTFTLYLNSIEQETSTWTSGDPEIVILDGFEVGTYNFTM
ncbi:MAG: hypothetical protein ACXAD7_29025, partial [Candidatus Kariarchaeaceae archaeon]